MNLLKSIFVFIGILLTVESARSEIIQAKQLLEIEDPAGDVGNMSDPGKDVVKVILDTDGTKIDISVLLKDDAKFYLEGHYASDVVIIYLDTDNNQETGGEPFGFSHKSKGFEYSITVGTCIKYKENATVCSGQSPGSTSDYFFSTYALFKHNNDNDRDQISEIFNWEDRGKKIEGNLVEVSLSYAEMNLSSGQTIRVSIKEKDDSSNPYMPEALFTLE